MTSDWTLVALAVGPALITGAVAIAVPHLQHRHEANVARVAERRRIYRELLDAIEDIADAFERHHQLGKGPNDYVDGISPLLRRCRKANMDAILALNRDELMMVHWLMGALSTFQPHEKETSERFAEARRSFTQFARTRIGHVESLA